jgi:hypothetical protein
LLSSADLNVESSAESVASANCVSNDLNSTWPSIIKALDANLDPSDLHIIDAETMASFGIEQNIIRLDELGVSLHKYVGKTQICLDTLDADSNP